MSTKIYASSTRNAGGCQAPRCYDMQGTPNNATTILESVPVTGSNNQLGDFRFATVPAEHPIWLLSERLAAETTISNNVTAKVMGYCSAGNSQSVIRIRLYTQTAGGVQTLLGEATMTTPLTTTSTLYTLTIPVPWPVVLAAGQRFTAEYTVLPYPGSPQIIQSFIRIGNTTTSETSFDFAETFTFTPNGIPLYLRRSGGTGIGNFFDVLPTRGSLAATTAIVNSAAGGTEIQWTRTAGGTVIEWISPRFKDPFYFVTPDTGLMATSFVLWLNESNAAANCSIRFKQARLRAGVETPCAQYDIALELPTAVTKWTINSVGGGTYTETPMDFKPDDRLIVRFYIYPIGTMGGGQTCTLTYDHNVANGTGDSFMTIYNTGALKAESDPPTPGTLPDGMAMGGIGN